MEEITRLNRGNQVKPSIDALSIGLFGLSVGAITLGAHQLALFGPENSLSQLSVWIIAFIFGGIVQLIAGAVEIKYDQQLGGTALTMYGFLWVTSAGLQILDNLMPLGVLPAIEIPLIATFALFSAFMVYLTAYKTQVLFFLHIVITLTLSCVVAAKMGLINETLPGIGHIAIGALAFVHAMGTLLNCFTEREVLPLGQPILSKEADLSQSATTIQVASQVG